MTNTNRHIIEKAMPSYAPKTLRLFPKFIPSKIAQDLKLPSSIDAFNGKILFPDLGENEIIFSDSTMIKSLGFIPLGNTLPCCLLVLDSKIKLEFTQDDKFYGLEVPKNSLVVIADEILRWNCTIIGDSWLIRYNTSKKSNYIAPKVEASPPIVRTQETQPIYFPKVEENSDPEDDDNPFNSLFD